MTVIDYAGARFSLAQLQAAGVTHVVRYLCPAPNSKLLTRDEARGLIGGGIRVGMVWETDGRSVSAAAAQRANAIADDLGAPTWAPIFYAIDYDANPGDVVPGFRAAMGVPGRPVGAYGSQRVVDAAMAAGVPYGWQTEAWSRHIVSARAHLLQYATRKVPGWDPASHDVNEILHPLPWWGDLAPVSPLVVDPARPVAPPTFTDFPGDHMRRIDLEIPTDGVGGWRDLPGLDVGTVVSVVPNSADPAGPSGHNGMATGCLGVTGATRVTVRRLDAPLPASVDVRVWVTEG